MEDSEPFNTIENKENTEITNLIDKHEAIERNLTWEVRKLEKDKVLLENESEKEGKLAGYTETMKLVNVKAPKSMLGQIVDVKITDVKTWSMDGKIA